MKRLGVLEDHKLIVEGFLLNLQKWGFGEIDHHLTGKELLAKIDSGTSYDLIILDLGVPKTNSEFVFHQLRSKIPNTKLLIYTGYRLPILAQYYLRHGAKGFVSKSSGLDELSLAIRLIMEGGTYLEAGLVEQSLKNNLSALLSLSKREMDVFILLVNDLPYKEIAEKLNIGVNTVGTYRTRIGDKLGVESIIEMKILAMELEDNSILSIK